MHSTAQHSAAQHSGQQQEPLDLRHTESHRHAQHGTAQHSAASNSRSSGPEAQQQHTSDGPQELLQRKASFSQALLASLQLALAKQLLEGGDNHLKRTLLPCSMDLRHSSSLRHASPGLHKLGHTSSSANNTHSHGFHATAFMQPSLAKRSKVGGAQAVS